MVFTYTYSNSTLINVNSRLLYVRISEISHSEQFGSTAAKSFPIRNYGKTKHLDYYSIKHRHVGTVSAFKTYINYETNKKIAMFEMATRPH